MYLANIERGKQAPGFEQRLDEITSREIDARTIDTYADSALNDLVDLVEDVVASYPDISGTGLSAEQEALKGVGLDALVVEQTLDHISEVARSIDRLDDLIEKKTSFRSSIILPPDSIDQIEVTRGDGSFEKTKDTIPKLKTLLLLLEKGLDIDIESDDVTISRGVVAPDMMRRQSYDMIEIKQLDRLVFSCDESGNMTFVFDTGVCRESGILPDDLASLTKKDLKELILLDARIGQGLNYGQNYAVHLGGALTGDLGQGSGRRIDVLKPKAPDAPEGYLSSYGITRQVAVNHYTVQKAIDTLGDSLGETASYRFGTNTTTGYSPEQQRQILEWIFINCKKAKLGSAALAIIGRSA